MSAIAEQVYEKVQIMPIHQQQEILDFADFILQKNQNQSQNLPKRPAHLHPVLSKINVNYDPTEPLSDDEWAGDK